MKYVIAAYDRSEHSKRIEPIDLPNTVDGLNWVRAHQKSKLAYDLLLLTFKQKQTKIQLWKH
jgi:hypothetical protein